MKTIKFKNMVPPHAGDIKIPMPLAPIIFGSSDEVRRLLVSTRIEVTCVPDSWKKFAGADIEKIRKTCVDPINGIHAESTTQMPLTFLDESTGKAWTSPEMKVYFSKDLDKSDCGIFGFVSDSTCLFSGASFSGGVTKLTIPG